MKPQKLIEVKIRIKCDGKMRNEEKPEGENKNNMKKATHTGHVKSTIYDMEMIIMNPLLITTQGQNCAQEQTPPPHTYLKLRPSKVKINLKFHDFQIFSFFH